MHRPLKQTAASTNHCDIYELTVMRARLSYANGYAPASGARDSLGGIAARWELEDLCGWIRAVAKPIRRNDFGAVDPKTTEILRHAEDDAAGNTAT